MYAKNTYSNHPLRYEITRHMKRVGKLKNNVRAGPELTNWLGKWKTNVNYFNILKNKLFILK